MLKLTAISIFVSLVSIVPGLKKNRKCYVLMSKSEAAALNLKHLAETEKEVPGNLTLGYSAAAEMALAKYKNNPVSKLKAFNSGRKHLEDAVAKDTASLEVRYIRLSVQQNAPSFLGYTSDIKKDRSFISHNLRPIKSSDPELFAAVYAYLITRSSLTKSARAFERQLKFHSSPKNILNRVKNP